MEVEHKDKIKINKNGLNLKNLWLIRDFNIDSSCIAAEHA